MTKTRRSESGKLLWLVWLLAGVAAAAQTPAATPCDRRQPTCETSAARPSEAPVRKSTAQQFPFPGEDPSTADKPGYPGADAPAAPQKTAPGNAPPAYPGDPEAPAATSSDSSSSSSSPDSAFDPNSDPPDTGDAGPLKDAGSSGDTTRIPIPRRRKLKKVNPETPESRVAEDLSVAEFYQNDGNYAAAFLRAKDAVEVMPNDPYTHFAMAEAARKLGKADEAREQYEQVLKLDPIPKQKNASERALAELGVAVKK